MIGLRVFSHRKCVFSSTNMTVNERKAPAKAFLMRWEMSRVTLYTAGHLHTAVPHCSHSRAPIVHTAVPRENNEHGCVYLRVCKLPGCVEGHPWMCRRVAVEHLAING